MDFYNRVKNSCEQKRGIKLSEMTRILGLSSGMPTKWKNGLIPNGDTLIKIADFLEESIDYLLGREQQPTTIPKDGINPKIQKISNILETEDIPDEVIDFIYKALENYNK